MSEPCLRENIVSLGEYLRWCMQEYGSCALLEGATAYVGFDECKEKYTNYFLCDGTADDVQIQAAIDYVAALGSGRVVLERGTYDVATTITVSSNIWLSGMGIDNTILTRSANTVTVVLVNADYNTTVYTGDEDIKISDLTIDMQGDTLTTAGVGIGFAHSTYLYVENVKILDAPVYHAIEVCACQYVWITRVVFDTQHNDDATLREAVQLEPSRGAFILTEPNDGTLTQDVWIEDCSVTGWCSGFGDHGNGIKRRVHILNNKITNFTGYGIRAREFHDSELSGNKIHDGVCQRGIYIRYGAGPSEDVIVSNNEIYNLTGANARGIHSQGDSVQRNQRIKYLNNLVRTIGRHGCSFDYTDFGEAIGNDVSDWGETGTGQNGLAVWNSSDCLISDNIVHDVHAGNTSSYGIIVYLISNRNQVIGNIIRNIDQVGSYGIYTDASENYGRFFHNVITGCTNVALLQGTDDQTATKTFQFIQGTTFISADGLAKGWEINAEADMAVALGQLPLEVQQVVRLKIWAVALGAPVGGGGQMHLDIVVQAGADDAAYTTENISLANFDSVTTDYVNNDVVHWSMDSGDDADIGDLVGGLSLECKINGGTAVAPDGATNATFRVLEIEYV